MLRLLSRAGGGGTIPPALGDGGWGPRGLRAGRGGWGGGGGGPRPRCSPSGWRPPVPYPGPLLVVGALPPGVRARLGSRGRPGRGGMRGGPWTAPPSDLNPPSALPEWAMAMGGSWGARPPYCSGAPLCAAPKLGPRAAPVRWCGLARPPRPPREQAAGGAGARGVQVQSHPPPPPRRLSAGAHPGLLYVRGPLAAGSPATHRQRPQQEAGTRMGQPPRTGVEPRPGGASAGRVAGRCHQGHGRPGPPRGANHARLPGGYPGGGSTGTAEPTVGGLHVQPGGRAHRRPRP